MRQLGTLNVTDFKARAFSYGGIGLLALFEAFWCCGVGPEINQRN